MCAIQLYPLTSWSKSLSSRAVISGLVNREDEEAPSLAVSRRRQWVNFGRLNYTRSDQLDPTKLGLNPTLIDAHMPSAVRRQETVDRLDDRLDERLRVLLPGRDPF